MEPAVGRNDRTVELGTVRTTPGDEKKLQVFCSIIPAIFGQLRGTTPELSLGDVQNCGNYDAKKTCKFFLSFFVA